MELRVPFTRLPRRSWRLRAASLIIGVAAVGWRGADEAPSRIAILSQFAAPVCVLHDTGQDVYLVANINGEGTAKDGNGYISRVSPDGRVLSLKFIEGGRDGATLNAPKGLAILGDVLWVADIDVVRSFDRRTGRPLRTVQMPSPGGLFLNGLTTGPDEAVYVTDTRLEFRGTDARHLGPDRIFRISRDGAASVALEADLDAPSHIAWDASQKRFLVTGLQGTHIFEWRPGSSPAPVWSGIGGYDGIVIDGARWLVSSLDGEGIYAIGAGTERRIIDHLTTPAAIGWDARRRQLLIPSFDGNTVQIWRVPGA